MWEKLQGYKTYLANGLAGAVLAVAGVAAGLGIDWHDVVPYWSYPYVGLALIALNLWLRFHTSTPAGPILPAKRKRRVR